MPFEVLSKSDSDAVAEGGSKMLVSKLRGARRPKAMRLKMRKHLSSPINRSNIAELEPEFSPII